MNINILSRNMQNLSYQLKLSKQCHLKKQTGSALIMSLVFLVILTILGFNASRNVVMQELLSRNLNDRSLAMQSAESALKYAEACVRNSSGLPTGVNSVAIKCINPGMATPIPFKPYAYQTLENADATFWISTGTEYGSMTSEAPLTLPSGSLSSQPRYVIAMQNFADCISKTQSCQYQITAWGTGINPTAQKVVQSIFIR